MNNGDSFARIDGEIDRLKIRQDKLLNMQLDEKISEQVYLTKTNQIENQIKELLEQKEALKNDDFEQKTLVMLELAGSFYRSYFGTNIEGKTYIIKNLMLELSVSNKKELRIEDSPIFKSSKMLLNSFGIPTENGTPVPALRRPCPNH